MSGARLFPDFAAVPTRRERIAARREAWQAQGEMFPVDQPAEAGRDVELRDGVRPVPGDRPLPVWHPERPRVRVEMTDEGYAEVDGPAEMFAGSRSTGRTLPDLCVPCQAGQHDRCAVMVMTKARDAGHTCHCPCRYCAWIDYDDDDLPDDDEEAVAAFEAEEADRDNRGEPLPVVDGVVQITENPVERFTYVVEVAAFPFHNSHTGRKPDACQMNALRLGIDQLVEHHPLGPDVAIALDVEAHVVRFTIDSPTRYGPTHVGDRCYQLARTVADRVPGGLLLAEPNVAEVVR